MTRRTLPAAAATLLLAAGPALALVMAAKPPAQRALTNEVVVVGTVTAVEKDTVDAAPAPGAPNKVAFTLAVVKVDRPLAGADNLTHLKVGFVAQPPPPVPQPGLPPRPLLPRRFGLPDLKAGDQYVFFLNRHPDGRFYVMPFASPPVDAKTDAGKAELEDVRKALAVVADPKKALTAAKAEDRAFAAAALVLKYRAFPEAGGATAEEPIGAEESRLILRGLAGGDWKQGRRFDVGPMVAFTQLGLTPQDGWTPPRPPRPVPGQPAPDYAQLSRDAFVAWLDGPGRDYRVKRVVPKK